ncbi:uncharacterized protein LOC144353219 [Saccoglossus kowalevskii]
MTTEIELEEKTPNCISQPSSPSVDYLTIDWKPTTNDVKYAEGIGIPQVTRRSRRLTIQQLLNRCTAGDLIELDYPGEVNQNSTWLVFIGNGTVCYSKDAEVKKDSLENVCGGKVTTGHYYRMDRGRGGAYTPRRMQIVKAAVSELKKDVQDVRWVNSEHFVTWCCFPRRFIDDDSQSNQSNGFLDITCETMSPYTISGVTVSRTGEIWCCRTDWTAESTIVVARQKERRILATGTIRKAGSYFFGLAVTSDGDVILVGRQGCFILIPDRKGQFTASKFGASLLDGCIVRGVACRGGYVYVKCIEEGRQDTYMAMCQVLTFGETGEFIRAVQLRAPLEGYMAVRSDRYMILTEFSSIKMFTSSGQHTNDFSFHNNVEGLAVDNYDNTIVSTNNHVHVLTPDFNQIYNFDLTPYNFTESPGIAVTPLGNIVVVDKTCSRRTKGCRILVFNTWPKEKNDKLNFQNCDAQPFIYDAIPYTKQTDTMNITWGTLLSEPEEDKMADGYVTTPEQIHLNDGQAMDRMMAFDEVEDERHRRIRLNGDSSYDVPEFVTPGYFCRACWVFCCLLCVPLFGVLIFLACHKKVMPPIISRYRRNQEKQYRIEE